MLGEEDIAARDEISQKTILEKVRNDLLRICSEKNRVNQKHYFKEEVNFIGCSNPQTREVAKKYWRTIKEANWKSWKVLKLSEALLGRRTFEEGLMGLDLTEHIVKDIDGKEILTFERWLEKYINNWALTDELGPHIIGELLEVHPELTERVFTWTSSDNRWARRAAAVTYVLHGRRGRFMPQSSKQLRY